MAEHADLARGLKSLATVAALAPLIGLLGTVDGLLLRSFTRLGGEKSRALANLNEHLSVSLYYTALGLVVALIALWFYRYLTARLAIMDHEMEDATAGLVHSLAALRGRMMPNPQRAQADAIPNFCTGMASQSWTWTHPRLVSGGLLAVAWFLQTRRFASLYFPLGLADLAGCLYVACLFAAFSIPAYFAWVKLLDRRPGGLPLIASALSLTWCLAEAILDVHLL